MDLGTRAMMAVLPKLGLLLKEEYHLQKNVKGGIKFLMMELERMQAALEKVSSVPAEQLDKNVRLWARDVREMSCDIEDIVDTFLVRVEGKKPPKSDSIKGLIDRCLNSLAKVKVRHKVAIDIKGIKSLVSEAKERHDRYNLDNVVVKPAPTSVDPRLVAMFRKVTELVGIDETRDELIKIVSKGDDEPKKKLKVVSVVGFGGLGKTTLAKVVFDELKAEFKCCAFVSVGQDPDVKKILKDILLELDNAKFESVHNITRDEKQLLDLVHKFLAKKRYFIVVDDMWDIQSWETIRLALAVNNLGSRIIITTRNFEVAKEAGVVYKLQPLSYDNSQKLFYTRIFGGEDKYMNNQLDEVPDKILNKCGGVPLAIITMASLLAGRPREEWFEVYCSMSFSRKDNRHAENTMRILSLSYNDMPSHLRTCLLYLSVFPEDYIILKDHLIWKWIAEGFVHEEQGVGLFEVGERYFNELMNRSMIKPVEDCEYGIVIGCRLHDMVFCLIRSLSCEENFVTVLDDGHDALAQSNARRFSYQKRKMEHNPQAQMVSTKVRSFIAYWCDLGVMFPLPSFRVLRVLDLEGCQFIEGYHLMHLGDLIHLRYLGLDGTHIRELPKEIGVLKFLQTLTFQRTGIEQLPLSISMLTQLVCLHGDQARTMAPAGGIIEKLTSLEDLRIRPGDAYNDKKQFMTELGKLRELRVLRMAVGEMDESLEVALLQSLCNMRKLRYLKIFGQSSGKLRWEATGSICALNLRQLLLEGFFHCSQPTWINCSLFPNLSFLSLDVESVDYRDMRILGRLPQLCCLNLRWVSTSVVVYGGDGYFRKLRSFYLGTWATVMFRGDKSRGSVMPSLEELQFCVPVRCSKDICVHHGQDISFLPVVIGLHILPSLAKISISIDCKNATLGEVDELEKTLRHTANSHPNRPTLELNLLDEAKMITFDKEPQLLSFDCRYDINYHVHVRELNDIGYGLDFTTLGNFPCLEKVIARINCEDARPGEVEEAEAATRHAVEAHPNHPTLEMERYSEDKMKVSCDRDEQLADDDMSTDNEEEEDAASSSRNG